MEKRITVHLNNQPVYDIVLEPSFQRLAEEAECFTAGRKVCIVTDSNVEKLYLEEVKAQLSSCSRQVTSFVFPAGEEYKNLDTVGSLYEHLILSKFDRKDILVALGGGVVGDLCGFAAATYLRGISFIQVPTTLLSQVDSSIGGKTGVDFDAYKNMVGAFHMPLLVYSNTGALLTLPKEQFSSGMGEIIKHGLIRSADYYSFLEAEWEKILSRDLDICGKMILESDYIKRDVVEEDPKEQGIRAFLNFGHTLGHAIEKLSDFRMLHGHCVALGCIAASYISAKRGLISHTEAEQIRNFIQSFHIPVTVSGLSADQVIEATKNDKKMEAGVIKFILLNGVGEACIYKNVTEEEMREGLSHIFA